MHLLESHPHHLTDPEQYLQDYKCLVCILLMDSSTVGTLISFDMAPVLHSSMSQMQLQITHTQHKVIIGLSVVVQTLQTLQIYEHFTVYISSCVNLTDFLFCHLAVIS